MQVPESERERLYYIWYELSVLYDDATRRPIDPAELAATKAEMQAAWERYVECILRDPILAIRTFGPDGRPHAENQDPR